ncbi:alpha-hydroxy acid oxidase [Vreelandella sulfidaeris]
MILNLDDYEVAARQRLPRPLFQYVAGAAETSAAFADNRAAFDALKLVPRMLRGVEGRTTRQRLFGQEWSAPFGIAPMGISALMAFDGDNVAARVAAREGIPYVLSGSSLTRMEEVIEANPQAWFQAYVPGEDDRISALIERVAAAGYETLVLTADTAVLANRENNLRAGFSTPLRFTPRMLWDFGTKPRWLAGTFLRTLRRRGMPHFENSDARRGAPIVSRQAARDFGRKDHLNWEHIRWVRDQWRGRLVLKGLLSHHDVAMARTIGCDGVVLSNHGGRQLDHAISAMRALLLARAEAGDMAVMLDGGVRRGTDVVKALALGADFVFIGRPFLFASAVGGDKALSHAVRIMQSEIHRNLGLLGCRSLDELDASIILDSSWAP